MYPTLPADFGNDPRRFRLTIRMSSANNLRSNLGNGQDVIEIGDKIAVAHAFLDTGGDTISSNSFP